MTYNKFFPIALFCIVLTSCQKETQKAIKQNSPPASVLQQKQPSLVEMAYQIDFKTDFTIPAREDGKPYGRPSDSEWLLGRTASKRDKTHLAETFIDSKAKVEDFLARNQDDRYTSTIQTVSLRYLRRYLLETQNAVNQEHALDLLRILVETKAVDIDVLVDTYLFTAPIMEESEQQRIFGYIAQLYNNHIADIRERAPEIITAYEESTGIERQKYTIWGLALSRKSKACAYSREKLPQLIDN